jgi:methionyl-tRNA formyltransferase
MMLKIIYFADGPWSHQAFANLLKNRNVQICEVVLRYETRDPVLWKLAEEAMIPVRWYENVNTLEVCEHFASYSPNLGVSMSFNQILRRSLQEVFQMGIINCHAGMLPLYRGRNILNWALINGESEFGVTCHYVDEGVDTGDIIVQKSYPITLEDTYATVLEAAYSSCTEVLCEAIECIINGTASRTPQQVQGTYYVARRTGDEYIDWNQSSRDIYNFIRAISKPGPQARTWLQIAETYTPVSINKACLMEQEGALKYRCVPGAVVGIHRSGNPIIKTIDTHIRLVEYEINHPVKNKLRIGDRLGLNYNLIMEKFILSQT